MKNTVKNKFHVDYNKKIAEFMGYTYYPHNSPEIQHSQDAGWKLDPKACNVPKFNEQMQLPPKAFLCRGHDDLKYHESFEWLIPVLNKIGDMGWVWGMNKWNPPYIAGKYTCYISHGMDKNYYGSSNGDIIEAVWLAVVEFIVNNKN